LIKKKEAEDEPSKSDDEKSVVDFISRSLKKKYLLEECVGVDSLDVKKELEVF